VVVQEVHEENSCTFGQFGYTLDIGHFFVSSPLRGDFSFLEFDMF